MTPYYDLYPKDPAENLRWRIRCRERALTDLRFRAALYQACMEDVLFFMAFAMWSVEPRAKIKIRPFIPWPHQESVFVAMDKAIDDAEREEKTIDVIVDKSRAQGGTFGYLWVDLRRWLRDRMFSAGYVTRNEDLVDSKTDSNTVLWKIAWAIDRLPFWMVPKGYDPTKHRSLTQHTFINPENGALLAGYAAGQDVAAGGRATVFTCLAAGTLVVTDHGPVPIEAVELHHRVWDGTMWVSHDGCVYQGERETIRSYRIRLTPDHRVLTVKGWKHASDGLDRADVRLPDGYSEGWSGQPGQAEVALPMSVRHGGDRKPKQSAGRGRQELRLLEAAGDRRQGEESRAVEDEHVPHLVANGSALHEPELQRLSGLRRQRNRCLRALADVRELPCGHGGEAGQVDTGAYQERSRLRTGELPLGDETGAIEQLPSQPYRRHGEWSAHARSGSEDCGHCVQQPETSHQEGPDGGCSFASTKTQTAVYDLLNCGPRRAFTVLDDGGRPLLVHNCDEFGAKDFISAGKDEAVMEALHDVTNCLRLVSARYADAGVFHEACENPDSTRNGVYLVLDWKDNPIHGKHAYTVTDGKPMARNPMDQPMVDAYHKENPDLRARLERKGFKFEGRVRSPWYDMRCLRPTSTPRLIASQLDRDPRGAVGKAFPTDLLDRMKREKCKPPLWQGQPVFDSETLKLTGLIPRDDGPLKLWFRPGLDFSPPLGPFTVGCDMAAGSDGAYSSNSVASGLDDRTGEQVVEYAIKGMELIKFARVVVGLCMWLRNARLGWEDSGMAGPFAKEIMEVIYYGNVYYRDVPEIGSRRKSRKAGWPVRNEDKAELFEKLALAMETGQYTPRSASMIAECGEYEWEDGKIIHAPTKNRGAVETNHGDRCIAASGCWLVFNSDAPPDKIDKNEETGETPEYGSFLWREQQERRVNSAGPGFGIRDVVNSF